MAASTRKKPSPPRELSREGAKFWRKVVGDYELRPDELRILEDCCHEMDLIDRLQAELVDSPLMVMGSQGQLVASPLVSEVRQHRAILKALLGALKLPSEDGAAGSASSAGRSLANQRWSRAS